MSRTPDRIWTCTHIGEYGEYFPNAIEAEGEYGGKAVSYILQSVCEVKDNRIAYLEGCIKEWAADRKARADLARPMTVAEAATHWAITSPSGVHIGLWSSYETAKRVFDNEVNGSKLWPLRALSQGGE